MKTITHNCSVFSFLQHASFVLNTVVYNVIKENLHCVLLYELSGDGITKNMLITWLVHMKHQRIYALDTIAQNFLFVLLVNICDGIHAGEQTKFCFELLIYLLWSLDAHISFKTIFLFLLIFVTNN
jgi:hypothetical protein